MTTVRVDPAILGGDDDGELTVWLVPDGARVEADQPARCANSLRKARR